MDDTQQQSAIVHQASTPGAAAEDVSSSRWKWGGRFLPHQLIGSVDCSGWCQVHCLLAHRQCERCQSLLSLWGLTVLQEAAVGQILVIAFSATEGGTRRCGVWWEGLPEGQLLLRLFPLAHPQSGAYAALGEHRRRHFSALCCVDFQRLKFPGQINAGA